MVWRMSFIIASAGGAQSIERRIIVVSAVAVGSLIRYLTALRGKGKRRGPRFARNRVQSFAGYRKIHFVQRKKKQKQKEATQSEMFCLDESIRVRVSSSG